MIQRFIELGEGYSDLYELIELSTANQYRVVQLIAFHSVVKGEKRTSVAVAMLPASEGNFQAIYICREGIPDPRIKMNKRYQLFKDLAERLEKNIIELEVKPSNVFAENDLFYQYLIGILRINRLISPMQ